MTSPGLWRNAQHRQLNFRQTISYLLPAISNPVHTCCPPRLDEKSQKQAITELIGIEPIFATVVENHGPPPLWQREESFGSLIQIILEQQVSLASARAAYDRLSTGLGKVTPANLLKTQR